jgi:hypothetical protein
MIFEGKLIACCGQLNFYKLIKQLNDDTTNCFTLINIPRQYKIL